MLPMSPDYRYILLHPLSGTEDSPFMAMIIILQGVQGAIEQQLRILSNASPSQKVALVTFNDEVMH